MVGRMVGRRIRWRWWCERLLAGWLLAGVTMPATAAVFGDVSDWNRYDTRHFRVFSDYSEAEASTRIHDLEAFVAFVHAAMGLRERAAPEPVDVYLFSRRADMIRLFNTPNILGFMRPGLRTSQLVIAPYYDSRNPNTVAFHEYVHYLLRNLSHGHFPPWYEEGLAEFFAAASIADGELVVGDVPRARVDALYRSHSLSVERVMTARQPTLHRFSRSADFYAQSWSIMHMLLMGHYAGLPRRDHLLVDYVLDIQQGTAPSTAFEHKFSGDFTALQRDLRRYIRLGRRLPKLRLPLAQFNYDPRYRRTPVAPQELKLRFGELVAPLSAVSARRLYRHALTREPGSVSALVGLGAAQRMAGRYQRAIASGERSLAASPENAMAHFEFAHSVSVACRAPEARDRTGRIDCNALAPRALASYERAIGLAPQDPEIQALYGVALLHNGDVERATRLLGQAQAVAPWSAGLNFALGEGYRRLGEFDRSTPLLQRAAAWFFKHPALQAQAEVALEMARNGVAAAPLVDGPGGDERWGVDRLQ